MSVQNLDYGACAKSHLTVRGLNLPAGWRVDEGGCANAAGAQAVVDDICFVVAVDPNTADGAYEIRIQAAQINYSDKAVMAATETVPLWVCVGGYNHYTQAWGDNAWTCDYGPVGSKTRVTGTSGTIHQPGVEYVRGELDVLFDFGRLSEEESARRRITPGILR